MALKVNSLPCHPIGALQAVGLGAHAADNKLRFATGGRVQ